MAAIPALRSGGEDEDPSGEPPTNRGKLVLWRQRDREEEEPLISTWYSGRRCLAGAYCTSRILKSRREWALCEECGPALDTDETS